MNYITQRALYYTFLMREISEAEKDCWLFMAERFGVDRSQAEELEAILSNPVLGELSSLGDIEIYKNYLSGFSAENEFGKKEAEEAVIDAKMHALIKVREMFGENSVKSGRLRALAHGYEKNHAASVLYALHILFFNGTAEGKKFAASLLLKELTEGKNSDAGLLLLNLEQENTQEIMLALGSAPDMLVRPDVLKKLSERFGEDCSGGQFGGKRTIGF